MADIPNLSKDEKRLPLFQRQETGQGRQWSLIFNNTLKMTRLKSDLPGSAHRSQKAWSYRDAISLGGGHTSDDVMHFPVCTVQFADSGCASPSLVAADDRRPRWLMEAPAQAPASPRLKLAVCVTEPRGKLSWWREQQPYVCHLGARSPHGKGLLDSATQGEGNCCFTKRRNL